MIAYSLSMGYLAGWESFNPVKAEVLFTETLISTPGEIVFVGACDLGTVKSELTSSILAKWFSWTGGISSSDLES